MKKTYTKLMLMLILMVGFGAAQAQQEYMITQYMYNGLSLNPAYAGIHEGISVSGLWREQWVAIDGAPSTQLLSIHSPLNYRQASVGALLYRDKVGVKTEHTGYFSYAYRVQLTANAKLSMGLQANVHQFNNDASALESQNGVVSNADPNDPLYSSFLSENVGMKGNFGAGLLLHSDRYYVGVSIPQLLRSKLFKDGISGENNPRLQQHLFATAGYVFNTENDLVLKPNLLMKYVKNAPLELDLNMNVLVSNILWLGASFRTHLSQSEEKGSIFESISGLVALQITPQMQVGYAYDFTTTALNTDSHEIMLNYIFNLPTNKILTPRYF